MTRRIAEPQEYGGAPRNPGFEEAAQLPLEGLPEALDHERVRTILETARSSGMLEGKTARISGRISPALLDQAKRRSGIESDTDLIVFALANLALDDDFTTVFRRVKGTVDADLPLGF